MLCISVFYYSLLMSERSLVSIDQIRLYSSNRVAELQSLNNELLNTVVYSKFLDMGNFMKLGAKTAAVNFIKEVSAST